MDLGILLLLKKRDGFGEVAPLFFMILVVLAAGLGSRYGGLKQLTPVGPNGEILLDYSVADAVRAGFSEIVFVIRRDIEEAFHRAIGSRYQTAYRDVKVRYVFQELTDLPEKINLPLSRTKPWGTGHALLAARHHVTTPFAVINADDYYGTAGYKLLNDFFKTASSPTSYAMIAYALKKTLSEHGSVSRGICDVDAAHFLTSITERTSIHRTSSAIVAEEKNGTIIPLPEQAWVSLNFWGLTPAIFPQLEEKFFQFLQQGKNISSAEFYLPSAISQLIEEKRASVRLFPTSDPWFGLTHPDDLAFVKKELALIPSAPQLFNS